MAFAEAMAVYLYLRGGSNEGVFGLTKGPFSFELRAVLTLI